MKYRKLRIAWSVAWSVVTVLLCVLWVRSYQPNANQYLTESCGLDYRVVASDGQLIFGSSLGPYDTDIVNYNFDYEDELGNLVSTMFPIAHPKRLPLSLFPILAVAVAFAPWLCPRFSLRTLLIATTLVAVGMGIIMYAARG